MPVNSFKNVSFAPGVRLGAYEVVALIGAGGMGEVYRARDCKLNRAVALKVLPEAFALDLDRLVRFKREARALASLNHPNIATIYGLEESGGVHALVLELVEGETLADRIAKGPISLDGALPIAKQIAEALEAAHENGIIHRDLKPANVKLRSDGTVKLLDFGLAKAIDAASGRLRLQQDLTESPTITGPAMTAGVGALLGTAAYMAPEQARGKAVDKRADIWAFGCVLYETLTGQRPFTGQTISETLAAVMNSEPDWTALLPDIPPTVRIVLRRCLEKDPSQRLRDAGDVRLALEGGFDIPVAATAAAASTRGWRRERMAWVVAVLLVAGVAAGLAVSYLQTPPAAPEMRVEINTPPTSDPISFTISPDGRRLVFVATRDEQPHLWLRPLDAVTAEPLAGTEGASYPFWSPDSRSVAFFAGGKLKRLDIGSGLPQTLADAPVGLGGTWSAQGIILFAWGAGPLYRVAASGGDAAAVTTIDTSRHFSHGFPQFLPGGRRFLFFARGIRDAQGIYLSSLDSPGVTRLTAAESAGTYLPAGWLLFVRQGTLVARRFDLSRGELIGDPVLVADPVGFDGVFLVGAFSASPAGLIGYRANAASRRQLTWFDRGGKILGTVGAPDANGLLNPELSPDGRRVAVDRAVEGNVDVWVLDSGRSTRLTFDPGVDHLPIWSPDGSRLVFDSSRKGPHHLYEKASSGAESEALLLETTQSKGASDWSSDGRFVLYSSVNPNRAYDLWVLPIEGERKPRVFLDTRADEREGQFSPDGRWVAYTSNESGQYQIYVRPFPGPGGQWQVSTAGGAYPRWKPDGKELYYIAPDGSLMSASIVATGGTLDPATPTRLFQPRVASTPLTRPQYDVSLDGRFLVNVTTEATTASPITVIVNWAARLKK